MMVFACDKVEPETPDTPDTPGTPEVPVEPEEPKDIYSLELSFPSVESLSFCWQNGDKVSAGTDNISEELTSVASQATSAVFTFPDKINNEDMLRFPVAANPNIFNIPASWTYTDGKYLPSTYPFVAKVVLEKGVETPKVTLTNVMAMIKVELKGSVSLTSIAIEAAGGQTLAGNYLLSADAAVSGNGNEGAITITFPDKLALSQTASVVYIPVRPNNYTNGFKLVLADDKGMTMQVKFCEAGKTLTNADVLTAPVEYEAGQDFSLGQLGSEAIGDVKPFNSLRIGQYNIWSDQDRESKLADYQDQVYKYRGWEYAGEYVASTAVAMDCDVICFNEISENLSKPTGLQALMEKYSKEYTYSLNWPNSVDGTWFWETSESTYANGFAYKASTVKLEASGKFWLNAEGSTTSDEQAGGKRTCVWAKFTQVSTNKVFYVAVTHLSIEKQGAEDGTADGYWNLATAQNLVAKLTERLGCTDQDTILLVGDMNSSSKDDTCLGYKYLAGALTEGNNTTLTFTDARESLKAADKLSAHEIGYPGTNNGNFNSVSSLSKEAERIDHIMFRNCTVSNYNSYRNTYRAAEDATGYAWFPSDHLPISVDVVL